MSRVFKPLILQTKQQLLAALRSGQIVTSKYNLLSRDEKIFVELVVFGGYTPEQAARAIFPKVKSAKAKARQLIAKQEVADTLEELSINQDKSFLAQASNYREQALEKLSYIMRTTQDESVAVVAAKAILEQSNKVYIEQAKRSKESEAGGTTVQIALIAANPAVSPEYNPNDQVVIKAETDDPEYEKNPKTGLVYELDFSGKSLTGEDLLEDVKDESDIID